MGLIRVVVADDDDAMRSALTEVLSADGRFEVVGTAGTAAEAVDVVELTRPHVVLLDVRMPGGGIAAARAIAAPGSVGVVSAGTTAPVVVAISAHTDIAVVVSMLAAGATGYLAKGRLRDLPDLVDRCASGEVVLAVPSAAGALRRLVGRGAPETTGLQ